MSLRGIFASNSGLPGERQTDLAARVLMTGYSGMAPLLALSSGMPRTPATQTNFSWIEDEHISGNQEATANKTDVATDLVVDDTGLWVAGTIIMNEVTGEYMFISAIVSDTAVTIVRGFAGTTAAAITDGDTLQLISSAHAEGGNKPTPVTQKGEERTNYVQIFKNGWAITGTAKAVKFLTGSQLAYNREMCFGYHAEDIERAFLWGKKAVTTATIDGQVQQLRVSDGVLAQIEGYGGLVESANYGGVAGDMALVGDDSLTNFLRRIFDVQAKGYPNERIAFAGSQLLELINRMVVYDTTYRIESAETEFGIKVTTILGFNGQLKILTHPLMVENTKWQQELYVLHPGLIRKRVLRDTWTETFSPNTQNNNGKDADEGYIAIEMGFEAKGVKTMGILRNIQNAVPSV